MNHLSHILNLTIHNCHLFSRLFLWSAIIFFHPSPGFAQLSTSSFSNKAIVVFESSSKEFTPLTTIYSCIYYDDRDDSGRGSRPEDFRDDYLNKLQAAYRNSNHAQLTAKLLNDCPEKLLEIEWVINLRIPAIWKVYVQNDEYVMRPINFPKQYRNATKLDRARLLVNAINHKGEDLTEIGVYPCEEDCRYQKEYIDSNFRFLLQNISDISGTSNASHELINLVLTAFNSKQPVELSISQRSEWYPFCESPAILQYSPPNQWELKCSSSSNKSWFIPLQNSLRLYQVSSRCGQVIFPNLDNSSAIQVSKKPGVALVFNDRAPLPDLSFITPRNQCKGSNRNYNITSTVSFNSVELFKNEGPPDLIPECVVEKHTLVNDIEIVQKEFYKWFDETPVLEEIYYWLKRTSTSQLSFPYILNVNPRPKDKFGRCEKIQIEDSRINTVTINSTLNKYLIKCDPPFAHNESPSFDPRTLWSFIELSTPFPVHCDK